MVNLFWQISVNLNLQLIITLWDKSVYSENEKSHPTWNLKINGKQSNFQKYNKKLKSKKVPHHPASIIHHPPPSEHNTLWNGGQYKIIKWSPSGMASLFPSRVIDSIFFESMG